MPDDHGHTEIVSLERPKQLLPKGLAKIESQFGGGKDTMTNDHPIYLLGGCSGKENLKNGVLCKLSFALEGNCEIPKTINTLNIVNISS